MNLNKLVLFVLAYVVALALLGVLTRKPPPQPFITGSTLSNVPEVSGIDTTGCVVGPEDGCITLPGRKCKNGSQGGSVTACNRGIACPGGCND